MITETNYMEYQSPQYRRLSDQQLQKIYHASLEILDRTGVLLYDQEALDLMKKAGARVVDENRVHIPPYLVEWALSRVPKQIRICDRNGQRTMPLERNNVFFGPGSDCNYVIDHHTGERLPGSLDFLEKGIRVCDALPNIDFVMSLCAPAEIKEKDTKLGNRHQMAAMLKNTIKPIIFVTMGFETFKDVIQMAEIVAGGADALSHNPNVINYINYAHPLKHNSESLKRLLYAAEKGLPSIYCTTVDGGASGPVTPAGGFALTNAGDLVGVTLAQLKREGSPVIPGAYHYNFSMNFNQGVIPEAPRTKGTRSELAHFQGLPAFGLGGASGSKMVDQQASAQAALSLITEAISGTNIIHDVGYLGGADIYSLEMLVIGNELIEYVKRFMQGMAVNEESLALDVIHEVGPHGTYMSHKHTMKHFRDEWYPELLDGLGYDKWVTDGKKTLAQRAGDKIDQILEEHQPEQLPPKVIKALDEIVEKSMT
jgi:trimethylamine---corrinoid protein Co-methyltransferase